MAAPPMAMGIAQDRATSRVRCPQATKKHSKIVNDEALLPLLTPTPRSFKTIGSIGVSSSNHS